MLAAGDGTWGIRNATSKSWDAASETENAGSRTTDAELASMNDSETVLSQFNWAARSGASCCFQNADPENSSYTCHLLHFLQLILNYDGLVNLMMKIWIVGVEQLKLALILETLKNHVLLLLIGVDINSGVS
jgi:hypothetical protein